MSVVPRRQPATAREVRNAAHLPSLGGWTRSIIFSGRLPAFLMAVAAGILSFGFLFTNDYQVTGIVVTGAELTDAREIAASAGVLGASVFDVDASEAARRIGQLPTIEQVETEVRFPGEVWMRVVEREPVVVWRVGGERLLIDQRGNVIARAGMTGLPEVRGEIELSPGDRIPPELVAAVTAIQAVDGAYGSFHWDRSDGLTLLLDEGIVIIGEPEEIPAKLAVLEAIQGRIDREWDELDLSEPERPVLR